MLQGLALGLSPLGSLPSPPEPRISPFSKFRSPEWDSVYNTHTDECIHTHPKKQTTEMEWNKPHFLSRIKNSQGWDYVFYSIITPSLKSGVLTFKSWFWHTMAVNVGKLLMLSVPLFPLWWSGEALGTSWALLGHADITARETGKCWTHDYVQIVITQYSSCSEF